MSDRVPIEHAPSTRFPNDYQVRGDNCARGDRFSWGLEHRSISITFETVLNPAQRLSRLFSLRHGNTRTRTTETICPAVHVPFHIKEHAEP